MTKTKLTGEHSLEILNVQLRGNNEKEYEIVLLHEEKHSSFKAYELLKVNEYETISLSFFYDKQKLLSYVNEKNGFGGWHLDSLSQTCRAAGLDSLAELVRMTKGETSKQTLTNWYKHKPTMLKITITGAAAIKREREKGEKHGN